MNLSNEEREQVATELKRFAEVLPICNVGGDYRHSSRG
jgi:hypothetical protein